MFKTMTISQLIGKLEQTRDLHGEKYVVMSSDIHGSSYGTIDSHRPSTSFDVKGNFFMIFPLDENVQLKDIESDFDDE